MHIRPPFFKMKILLLGSLLVLASGTRLDSLPGHSHGEEYFQRTPNNNLVHIRYGTERNHGSLDYSGSHSQSSFDSRSRGFSVDQSLSRLSSSQQDLNLNNAQYQRYSNQGQVNNNLRGIQGRNDLSVLTYQANRNQFSQGQQSNRNEYDQAQQFHKNQFLQDQQSNKNQFSLQNQQSNRNQFSLQNQQSNRNQFSLQNQQSNRNQFSLHNQQSNRNQFSLQNQQSNRNKFSTQNQQSNRNLFSTRNQFLNDNQQSDRNQFFIQNQQASQNQFSNQNQPSINSQVSRQGQYYEGNNQGNNQQYSLSNRRYSSPNLAEVNAGDVSSFRSQNRHEKAQFRSNQNPAGRFSFNQNQGSNRFTSEQNIDNSRFQFDQNQGSRRFRFDQNQGNNRFQSNQNLDDSRIKSFQNQRGNRFQTSQNQGSRFNTQGFGLQNQQGQSSSFRTQDFQQGLARQDQQQQIASRLQSRNNQFQHSGNKFQTSSQQFHSSDRQAHGSQNALNSQFNTNLQTSQLKEIAGRIETAAGDKVLGVFQTFSVPATASLAEGQISSTFSCSSYGQGYFADPESSCRMFHVCTPVKATDGAATQYRFTFRCGEGEEFDQRTLTCSRSSTSCSSASSLFGSSKERSQHLYSGFSSFDDVSADKGTCYLANDTIITGVRRK